MADTAWRRAIFDVHLRISARLLPLIVPRDGMDAMRRYVRPAKSKPYAGLSHDYIVRRVAKITRRPWLMRDRRCLREGLLGYRFLRLAGFDAELRFGVDQGSLGAPMLRAHCWVCLEGQAVLNARSPGMVEIWRLPIAAGSGPS